MESLATKIGDYLKDIATTKDTKLIEHLRIFCLMVSYGFYRTDENLERIQKYQRVWDMLEMNDEVGEEIIKFSTNILEHIRMFHKNSDKLDPQDITVIRSPGELYASYINKVYR